MGPRVILQSLELILEVKGAKVVEEMFLWFLKSFFSLKIPFLQSEEIKEFSCLGLGLRGKGGSEVFSIFW